MSRARVLRGALASVAALGLFAGIARAAALEPLVPDAAAHPYRL